MSINQIGEKIKGKLGKIGEYEKELSVALLVILVALLAFGLGRLSRLESDKMPVQIEGADVLKN
ncbi:MAG: hypothetical protein WCV68_01000 [Candidatus Paceibacterota bacterium]|jgi:hypothetical protein